MEQKYLPIGSVCTLKGKNKKVMITGYYSVEFNGNLKIKDYCGCVYPEGMLLPEQNCIFNHSDIDEINFMGYKNEEQTIFQNLLNRLTGNGQTDEENARDFHIHNDMILTSNKSYSKLLFDENGVVMIAESIPEKESNKTSENIKFDENGTVISVENNNQISNPFYKKMEDVKEPEEKNSSEWNIFNNIEFDENGTVISYEETDEYADKLNKIEFDENGTVISINDEDNEEEVPPIGPGLPGYVEPKKESKYEFDENGTVVSA